MLDKCMRESEAMGFLVHVRNAFQFPGLSLEGILNGKAFVHAKPHQDIMTRNILLLQPIVRPKISG